MSNSQVELPPRQSSKSAQFRFIDLSENTEASPEPSNIMQDPSWFRDYINANAYDDCIAEDALNHEDSMTSAAVFSEFPYLGEYDLLSLDTAFRPLSHSFDVPQEQLGSSIWADFNTVSEYMTQSTSSEEIDNHSGQSSVSIASWPWNSEMLLSTSISSCELRHSPDETSSLFSSDQSAPAPQEMIKRRIRQQDPLTCPHCCTSVRTAHQLR